MNKEVIENNDNNDNNSPKSVPDVQALDSFPDPEDEALNVKIASYTVADQLVRSDGKFLHVDHLGKRLRYGDAQSLVRKIIRNQFPFAYKRPDTMKSIMDRVFSEDPEQSIALWDGTTRCAPGKYNRVRRGQLMASINTWKSPEYRSLGVKDAEMGVLEDFLDQTMPLQQDRTLFLDWLSWCLQNEASKPGFAALLYSREKGTGKSTLCQLVTRLFGKVNTFSMNGVSQVTGRFNKPLLDSKLLVLEELKLKPNSDQGNTLKTYITEEDTSAERKGVDIQKTTQCCCFLFTTNHLPQWIEGNDRRFHVIDMGHDGHASGPKSKEFADFMVTFYEWMDNPENIAKVYNALMHRKQSEDFNPKALDTSKLDTPVMKQIRSTSREALQQQLEELLEDDGRGAIPQGKLIQLAQESLRINGNRLNHMMPDLGWRLEKVKWGGKDYARAIWVKTGYSLQRGHVSGPDGYDHPIDKQPGYDIVQRL